MALNLAGPNHPCRARAEVGEASTLTLMTNFLKQQAMLDAIQAPRGVYGVELGGPQPSMPRPCRSWRSFHIDSNDRACGMRIKKFKNATAGQDGEGEGETPVTGLFNKNKFLYAGQ